MKYPAEQCICSNVERAEKKPRRGWACMYFPYLLNSGNGICQLTSTVSSNAPVGCLWLGPCKLPQTHSKFSATQASQSASGPRFIATCRRFPRLSFLANRSLFMCCSHPETQRPFRSSKDVASVNMDGFHDLIRNQALLSSACGKQSASSNSPEKRYRCATCGQGFSRAEHLKRHQTRRG